MFGVKGRSEVVDINFLDPYVLHLWVLKQFDLQERTSIQVGFDLDVSGQMHRSHHLGYAAFLADYVVLDAYLKPIAKVPAYHKIIQWPLDPLRTDISGIIGNETHRDITIGLGPLSFPIILKPGPYWIGAECRIGLLRGGVIEGMNPEETFTVRVGGIVGAPS